MNWNNLTDITQLNTIDEESKTQKVMILKHSTRCSISSAALGRIERKWKEDDESSVKPYYLDLIAHRDISNAIETRYSVYHESPQVLIISNGKCIFSQTHMGIDLGEIMGVAVG